MGFSPNGMIMDLLRSCYSQQVLFNRDDVTAETTCRWYFTNPEAKVFPSWHTFGSPTWDTAHPTVTTLGWDDTTTRSYDKGARTNVSDGKGYAGALEFFQQGQPSGTDPLVYGVGNTPVVCLPGMAGLRKGGKGQFSAISTCLPVDMPRVIYSRLRITAPDGSGTFHLSLGWNPNYLYAGFPVNVDKGAWTCDFTFVGIRFRAVVTCVRNFPYFGPYGYILQIPTALASFPTLGIPSQITRIPFAIPATGSIFFTYTNHIGVRVGTVDNSLLSSYYVE